MQAIVLSRRDWREYDQIISLYTKAAGKREALARGIKKITAKNAGGLEPATLAEVEMVPGRGIDRLVTAQPLALFPSLRAELAKSWQAQQALSLVDRLTHRGEKQVSLFNLLAGWLFALDRAHQPSAIGIVAFIWRLLSELGFRPSLAGVAAEPNRSLVFSIPHGGLVNPHRLERGEVFALAVPLFRTIQACLVAPWSIIFKLPLAKPDLATLNDLTYAYATYHSGVTFPDWRGVDRILDGK